MSSPNRVRWSELAAIVAGVLFLISNLLDLTSDSPGMGADDFGVTPTVLSTVQTATTLVAGVLLLLLELVGL